MDLANLKMAAAAEEGAVLALRHPGDGTALIDDAGKPMTITVVGTDSEVFRKAERAIINRRLKGRKPDAAELEAESTSILARCTTGWHLVMGGKPLEFSQAEAEKLYGDPNYRWLREQVDEFMADRANFSKASQKT